MDNWRYPPIPPSRIAQYHCVCHSMANAVRMMVNVDVLPVGVAKTVCSRVSSLHLYCCAIYWRLNMWGPLANAELNVLVVCGSLVDGENRYPRKDGESCECKDGWGGINCNGAFPLLPFSPAYIRSSDITLCEQSYHPSICCPSSLSE